MYPKLALDRYRSARPRGFNSQPRRNRSSTAKSRILVANLNLSAFAKADELKKRIWFTLGALLIYRLGTYIPIPGINPQALAEVFRQQQSGLLGMFNMFSGGAVERM